MKATDRIDIQSTARGWLLEQTPITTRLRKALHKHGYRLLGELHRKHFADIRKVCGCGVGSIDDFKRFLARMHAGEFDKLAAAKTTDALGRCISIIDQFCNDLSARNRDIVLSRLGGNKEPLRLAEIGRKYDLTRERVRQVVNMRISQLRRYGGPPFLQMGRAITQRCEEVVCPLTPELLPQWIDAEQSYRYTPRFYVRVLAVLVPECPAWPKERATGSPSERQALITKEVKQLIRGRCTPLLAREVLQQLTTKKAFSSLTATEFLAALYEDRSIGIRFSQPDQLQVLPLAPDPVECVKQVLLNSDHALSLTDILERAHKIWGDRALDLPSYRLTRLFRPENGIYLLEDEVFGLRKHIRLPESAWARVRNSIEELLEREVWMLSTFDVIKQHRFDWTHAINAYELAAILRNDARFAETEPGSFMLTLPAAVPTMPTSVVQLQSRDPLRQAV